MSDPFAQLPSPLPTLQPTGTVPSPPRTHPLADCDFFYRFGSAYVHNAAQHSFAVQSKWQREGQSVVEFTLCGDEESNSSRAARDAVTDAISSRDVHALFAPPPCARHASSASHRPLAHHRAFLKYCSPFTCRLFDVVVGDGLEKDKEGRGVQRLSEAVSLALTAHTGVLTVSPPAAAAAALRVSAVAESLHFRLFQLLPRSVWSVLSLGLTLASTTGSSLLAMNWSWVTVSGEKAVPDALCSYQEVSPACDALWQYWAASMTLTQHGTVSPTRASGDEVYATYMNPSAAHRRLRLYAHRARHLLIPPCRVGEREDEAQLCCALLAVLAEARVLEKHWASPLVLLHLRDAHVFVRYLTVWFTFIGCAHQPSVEAVQVEASVRAVLLRVQSSTSEQRQCCESLPVLLRQVCTWCTAAILSSALRWMPLSLAVDTPLRQQRETHVLFRDGGSGLSHAASHHRPHDSTSRTQDRGTKRAKEWDQLLDALLLCVAGNATELRNSMVAPAAAVLTRRLFTHPAPYGVTVCRLHLSASPDSVVFARCSVYPLPSLTFAARHRVVAALIAWYAVDFETVFDRCYRRWALMQRYGLFLPPYRHQENGGLAVNPAIVCHRTTAAQLTSVNWVERDDSSPLGLLGRCLLLALWMQLRLVDVDLEEESDVSPLSRTTTTTCGTLHYSSRRCMLFVRDWRTLRHLHTVLVRTSAEMEEQDACETSALPSVEHAAATVTLAFLRARQAHLDRGERHRQALLTAVKIRAAHDERQRRMVRAVSIVQAWLRAELSSRSVAAKIPHDAAVTAAHDGSCPSIAGEQVDEGEEEGSCVLLHWSAVEDDASLPSLESIRPSQPLRQEEKALAAAAAETSDDADDDGPWPCTPSRELAAEPSFAVSVEVCSVVEGEEETPSSLLFSTPPSTLPVDVFPPVPSPLTLGKQHLLRLEVHARALLKRKQLSELLWFTIVLESVGRRAEEESEARAWYLLVRQGEGRLWQIRAPAAALTCRRGTQLLHEDELVPVSALLPALLPLPLSDNTTDVLGSRWWEEASTALQKDEVAARLILEEAEARHRDTMCDAHQLLYAQCLLVSQEAQRRRFTCAVWALEQGEWQVRWAVLVVPECVLRDVLTEAFAKERPTAVSTAAVRHVDSCMEKKAALPRAGRPPCRVASLVDAAKTHRAFLLMQDGSAEELGGTPSPLPLQPCVAAPAPSPPRGTIRAPVQRRTEWTLSSASTSPVGPPKAALAATSASGSSRRSGGGGVRTRIPVVAVSLCYESNDSTAAAPLLERAVNSLPSPSLTQKATGPPPDVVEVARRCAEGNEGGATREDSRQPRGWWYVPLSPDSAADTMSGKGDRVGPLRTPSRPLSYTARPTGEPHTWRMGIAPPGTTQRFTAKGRAVNEDVSAAIALARDSGYVAAGTCHLLQAGVRSVSPSRTAPTGAEAVQPVGAPSQLRQSRKRFVTWADDVQEY